MTDRANGQHFRKIAGSYDRYRTFDREPIDHLASVIPGPVQAICELGTGTGRYLIPLVTAFTKKGVVVKDAYGIDTSPEMLEMARGESEQLHLPIQWFRGTSDRTGIETDRLSLVTTFNAFHHFPVAETLRETARILKPGGWMGIHIRSLDQEREHIWGRYFPGFVSHSKVPTRRQMEDLPLTNPAFRLADVTVFSYKRRTTLDWVLEQARNKHYSTFEHYPDEEFTIAFEEFEQNLRTNFPDPQHVVYRSSYNLFLYQLGDDTST
jgi:SAM-dependent methyltransferase